MSIEKHLLENTIGVFINYRALAEKSFAQLEDPGFLLGRAQCGFHAPPRFFNSVKILAESEANHAGALF